MCCVKNCWKSLYEKAARFLKENIVFISLTLFVIASSYCILYDVFKNIYSDALKNIPPVVFDSKSIDLSRENEIGVNRKEEIAALGQIGDFFGGLLNPLISMAALVFIMAGFYTQRNAFELQKEELELTREELKKSAEALEKQNETIKLQRFETTFFNLIQDIRSPDSSLITAFFALSDKELTGLLSRSEINHGDMAKEVRNKLSISSYNSWKQIFTKACFLFKFVEVSAGLKNKNLYFEMAKNLLPAIFINYYFLVYVTENRDKNNKSLPKTIDFANKYGIFSSSGFYYEPRYFPLVDEAAWGDSLEEKRAAYLAYLQEQGITPNETQS